MARGKKIVMVGTKSNSFGGIASVIALYETHGLFQRQNIVYLPTHCTGTSAQKCFLLMAAIARFSVLLLRREISILHAHVACDTSFWRKALFLMIARACGIPTVLHVHAGHFPKFYDERCNKVERALVRYVLEKVKHVVVVSNALNRWIQTISRQRSVITIFNPAIVEEQDHLVERDQATLLFLGHLRKAKGTYDLVHAMPKVISAVPDVKLLLCGDGDISGTNELIQLLGLEDHVRVVGWVDSRSRAQLLSSATVLVLPSYAEGLPMCVLEAMAAGLPVISTHVGGTPEAISSEIEGLLIEPGDVDALENSIVRLLQDPDQRSKFAESARSKVQNEFSVDKTISSLESLYDHIRREQMSLFSKNSIDGRCEQAQPDTDKQF